MKQLILIILGVLLPFLLLAQPQFSFEGERLNFSLMRSASADTLIWSVVGDYYLSNLHDEALTRLIVFPVPSTPEIGIAEDIKLELIAPGDSMAVELQDQSDKGFSFCLDLPGRSFAKLRISYHQKIIGKTAHYVLLTANSWGRPLPYCDMTLILAPGIEPDSLPFASPSMSSNAQGTIYHWQFMDFSPAQDFILKIR